MQDTWFLSFNHNSKPTKSTLKTWVQVLEPKETTSTRARDHTQNKREKREVSEWLCGGRGCLPSSPGSDLWDCSKYLLQF